MKFRFALILAGSCVALPALAQQTVTIRNTAGPSNAAAVAAQWTTERMQAAQPLDLGIVNPMLDQAGKTDAGTTGQPGVACDKQDCGLSQALNTPAPADGSYPGPHTTFENLPGTPYSLPYLTRPNSAVGVLFFHDPVGGGDFRCSASSIYTGQNLNAVVTAGHCLANGGHSQFYNNWVYCPGYKAGPNGNFGCWGWLSGSTTAAWFFNGAFSRDVAVLSLQHNSTVLNEDVVVATGGFGFAWNWGRDQHWDEIGYPVQAITGWPFNGNYRWVTETEHRYDVSVDGFGPAVNSIGSPQTPGASGSPVLLFWNQSFGGFVNGVISFYFSGGPNGNELGHELQFAYFDTFVCNALLKPVTGWPGTC